MIKYVNHGGNKYPEWQSIGNAMQWIMPLAKHILTPEMMVVDIGFSKDEWRFPNAYGVDPAVIPEHGDAMNFTPDFNEWDAIISSHMLEHIKGNWADCLDYWLSKIKDDGVLFLYLPHSSQTYWHPTSNRKHIHSFDSTEIKAYLQSLGYDPYVTPVDYNNSFAVICYKTKVKSCIDEYSDLIDEIKKVKLILSDDGEVGSEDRLVNSMDELKGNRYVIKNEHGEILEWGDKRESEIFKKEFLSTHDNTIPPINPFNPGQDADKLEAELKAKGISYIRDGDMIMYNDPSPIKPFVTPIVQIEAEYSRESEAIWYNGKRYTL